VETPEQIKSRLEAAVPGAKIEVLPNDCPAGERSLLVDPAHALVLAKFLRDDPQLRLDYCSNVTGVDWPEAEITEKIKVKQIVDGVGKEIEEVKKTVRPGFLEVVYHLYSMALKHGPVVLRQRTANRDAEAPAVSLMAVWRGCEFQEREVFDLFGIRLEGHPDLRRILMWDGFKGFPMRKDYVAPDDFEYEPTPHDEVLEQASKHYPPEVKA
jgi:NADH-quinone oxidoreductase subunit C